MRKLLISGGNGKFAQEVIKQNEDFYIIAPSRQEMDITKYQEIDRYISEHSPDIFLHAAAYTRPMNKHQENADISIQTNIIGTSNVVLACMKHNVKLVYISTDYVYPGTVGNYNEFSPLSPYYGNNDGVTKYGWSKLGGECSVSMYDNSLILIVCMCDYPFPHKNALTDVKKSMMFNYDAARIVLKLLDHYGIINVGGPAKTVYEFASQHKPKIGKITRSDVGDVKIAPDTSMNTEKMENLIR